LKFFFGDHSTHAGNFVFHAGVNGQLKRAWSWPASQFMAIMALTGDKTIRISDDGAAKITVDSWRGCLQLHLTSTKQVSDQDNLTAKQLIMLCSCQPYQVSMPPL
jgi:hypothetical protein